MTLCIGVKEHGDRLNETIQRMVDGADTDGDGVVSYDGNCYIHTHTYSNLCSVQCHDIGVFVYTDDVCGYYVNRVFACNDGSCIPLSLLILFFKEGRIASQYSLN